MLGSLSARIGFRRRREPLGRVLVRAGVVTEEQLAAALETQKRTGKPLGRTIVEEGFATEFDVLQAIARSWGVSATDLGDDLQGFLEAVPSSWGERLAGLRIPIRFKLSIVITFMIWVTVLALSMVLLLRQRETLANLTMRAGMVSLTYFAENAAMALLQDDTLRLNVLVKDAPSVEGLVYASITDLDGTVVAHSDTSLIGTPAPPLPQGEETAAGPKVVARTFRSPGGERIMDLSQPVAFSGTALGEANVGVSLDFIDRQIWRETLTVAVLALLIVLLGISIAVLVGVGFSRPISQLVLATREIGKGNFQYQVGRVRGDELGDLASAFNFMSRELWKKLKMQKSFGSYVSPEILEMLMARPGEDWLRGTRAEVTVLFADVRGFTPYAEANEPERVVEAVNEYFRIATEHIDAEGGYVDKFIGDAVLGVFGAPIAREDHAARAVRAAVAMQRALLAGAAGGNPLLARVGIGVNSGVAVAGDLGSEVKRNYSVIGDCVNVASRLNAFAAGGRVIVSRSTLEAVGELVEAVALEPVRVKGKSEPIEIYDVTGLRGGPPLPRPFPAPAGTA